MPGIPVSSISNTPSITAEERYRIANTTTAGYLALASGANGTTALGLVVAEETTIEDVLFMPDAKPGSTVTFSVGVAGGYTQGAGPDTGTYASASLPTGLMADANRATEAIDLNGSSFTNGTLRRIPIHKSSGQNSNTNSRLNNNVIPPGGQVYVHTSENVAAITFTGTLIIRTRTKSR